MTERNSVLSQALSVHLALGEDLQRRPYSLAEAGFAGVIDAVAVDEAGRCWVLGWVKGEIGDALGVLILGEAKHPGSLVLARFPRAGLVEGASGFVGLLRSKWQPQAEIGKVAMLISAPGQPHLRSAGDRLRKIGQSAFSQIIKAAQTQMSGPYQAEIAELLMPRADAAPAASAAAQPSKAATADVSIETVVGIAGIGCVVQGWVVSPRQAVTGFSLQTGAAVTRADMRSTYRMARPDVAKAFPRAAEILGDAGFVAFFPLTDAQALTRELTMIFHLGQREVVKLAVPEHQVQWLHRGAGEDVMLRCYPALECEPFFPAMAAMLKRTALMQASRPAIWRSIPTRRAVVVAMADHHDEAFRVMDCFDQWRGLAKAHEAGFVLMAPQTRRREVLKLVQEWPQAEGEPSLSLFFQTAGAVTPMDLALILKAMDAETTLFIREGMRLDGATAAKCLQLLSKAQEQPAALALHAMADLPATREAEGPGALIWSVSALDQAARAGANWADLPTMPKPEGGVLRAIRPKTKRPMLRVLQSAGWKI